MAEAANALEARAGRPARASRPSSRPCARRTTPAGDAAATRRRASWTRRRSRSAGSKTDIRYVVEGRQRVEQRLAAAAGAERAVGRAPGRTPSAELEDIWPSQIAGGRRAGRACWRRRPRSRRCSCPAWRTPLRAAQSRSQRSSAAA
ncbi:MAG: hypothetical protein MZW92_33830 [Comamonadaceae bacterium]|nr:hypothetical protein [Comamonadaceae bacterium]